VRVIGGRWRGRPLEAPAGRGTRPTSDKVREAVFDVLGSLVLAGEVPGGEADAGEEGEAGPLAGLRVLDLYAGSGALGIEALSRGAAMCTFVETAKPALRALRANLRRLDVGGDRVVVVPRPAARAVRDEAAAGRRYTLLFADPPYDDYRGQEGLLAAAIAGLLCHDGLAIVETARGIQPGPDVVTSRTYGDTRITFVRNTGRPERPLEE